METCLWTILESTSHCFWATILWLQNQKCILHIAFRNTFWTWITCFSTRNSMEIFKHHYNICYIVLLQRMFVTIILRNLYILFLSNIDLISNTKKRTLECLTQIINHIKINLSTFSNILTLTHTSKSNTKVQTKLAQCQTQFIKHRTPKLLTMCH